MSFSIYFWIITSIIYFFLFIKLPGNFIYFINPFIPRFASFSLEPVGLALVVFGYILYSYSSQPSRGMFFAPIILISTISTINLFYIIVVIFRQKKIFIYLGFIFLIIFLCYLCISTRFGESISVRSEAYWRVLNNSQFYFFGKGIYNSQIAGIPGFFKFMYEFGFVFFVFFICIYITMFFKIGIYKSTVKFFAYILPFITETYMAPYYFWFKIT